MLLRIAAHVGERQNGDRRFVGKRQRGFGEYEPRTIGILKTRTGLAMFFSAARPCPRMQGAPAKGFIAHLGRDADTARFRQRLQPRRDVDTVAIDVRPFADNVTEIDADSQVDRRSSLSERWPRPFSPAVPAPP